LDLVLERGLVPVFVHFFCHTFLRIFINCDVDFVISSVVEKLSLVFAADSKLNEITFYSMYKFNVTAILSESFNDILNRPKAAH